MPRTVLWPWLGEESLRAPNEGLTAYQVVGGVKAYQADDG